MGTGTPWPRMLLVQAAHAARGRKGTYLGAQQRCLAARRAKGGGGGGRPRAV